MPVYKYVAKDMNGKTISGTMKAETDTSLVTELSQKQLFLISSTEVVIESKTGKFTFKELARFSREAGTMLAAGVTLSRVMEIILSRNIEPKEKKIYTDILQALKGGSSFSDALKAQTNVFPDLFINMIMAGEASGQLDKTILKMASYYESESRMRGKIKSAMTYPIFLLSLTVLVVICLFAFVLPKFFTMFKGAALPLPTRIVIAISNFITGYWYVLLVMVILLVMLLKYMLRQYSVQISLDKALLNFPKIGRLFRIVYTARFARTLSALYLSGLPLVNCLQVGYNTIGNKYIISQFTDVINQVKSGKNLSTAIAQLDGFDTILSSYIIIGEESGRLSEMLNSVADSLDYESESAIQRLISLLEPLMIVIMALVVGSIMISVMMPIFSLYQNMEA